METGRFRFGSTHLGRFDRRCFSEPMYTSIQNGVKLEQLTYYGFSGMKMNGQASAPIPGGDAAASVAVPIALC